MFSKISATIALVGAASLGLYSTNSDDLPECCQEQGSCCLAGEDCCPASAVAAIESTGEGECCASAECCAEKEASCAVGGECHDSGVLGDVAVEIVLPNSGNVENAAKCADGDCAVGQCVDGQCTTDHCAEGHCADVPSNESTQATL